MYSNGVPGIARTEWRYHDLHAISLIVQVIIRAMVNSPVAMCACEDAAAECAADWWVCTCYLSEDAWAYGKGLV
jgi:hypothetical protein